MSEMQSTTDAPVVLCVMGPTAIGKSALAVNLAQDLGCEIVSVDSMLVYRGMDIGTAKPIQEQKGGIPHHLIDILDPAEIYSTGRFREDALILIEDIINRNKIPLLVGGTMLYFKALFGGLADLPAANAIVRNELNQQAARVGWKAMHEELMAVDPESAMRIHQNDPQRIQRALEVFRVSAEPISVLMKKYAQNPLDYQFVKLAVVPEDRSHLHMKIQKRFVAMLEQGLIQETQKLFARQDLNPDLPALRAVGYRQVWSYLDEQMDYSTMIERAVIATRQLAKRQLTWLRSADLTLEYSVGETMPYSKIMTDLGATLN